MSVRQPRGYRFAHVARISRLLSTILTLMTAFFSLRLFITPEIILSCSVLRRSALLLTV